jgi:hypothetical protein
MINFLRWLLAFIIVFCMACTLDTFIYKHLTSENSFDKCVVMIAKLGFGWFYLYPQVKNIYKQLGGKDE